MKVRNCSLLVLLIALWAAPAMAQEDAAESRSAEFKAVEGKTEKDVPGYPLMIGAYGFILVLLVGYVARLGSLHAKNRGELERLTQAIERGRKA